MKKIILFVMMLLCFAVLVDASLYSKFGTWSSYKCTIVDYGKVSAPALVSKFGGGTYCTITLDYGSFENETAEAVSRKSIPYYGRIEYSGGNVFILGKDLNALNEVIGAVVDYTEHSALFRDEYVIFFNDDYFRLTEQGYDMEEPSNEPDFSGCQDSGELNRYVANSGSYGNPVYEFSSRCIDASNLYYPYCDGGSFTTKIISCNCVQDKCVAKLGNVWDYIGACCWDPFMMGTGKTSPWLVKETIKSWIDS